MPLRYRRVTYRYTMPGSNVEQFFRRIWETNRQPAWAAQARWRPPTDVLEGATGLFVKVELGGISEDAVEITLFDDMLVISGRRDEDYPDGLDCRSQQCRFHESGIRYGEFQVEVYLPVAVEAEQVVARYDRGFLYVNLPKRNAE